MMRPLIGAFACAMAFNSVAAAIAHAAPAPAIASEPAVNRKIVVPRDKTLAFRLNGPAGRIVVAQTDIAQIVATSDRTFYVRGKEFGSTNLLVYEPGGRLAEIIDVYVTYDAAAMEDALSSAFPDESIQVSNAGQGLLLTGQVSTTGVSARAQKIAEKYAPEYVTNNLVVRAAQEVVLEVRVLEASRSMLHDIGVNLDIFNNSFQVLTGNGLIGSDSPQGVLTLMGGSGHTTIDSQLQVLENKGLVRTLAKPNLVAISGAHASFLAGGEFPYPVPQTGSGGSTTITIEFRQYGVKLDFKPLVQDNGLIQLEVAPEVSALDPTNSVRINGFSVPGLITRRANTTVELRNGSSLAIGGLFQDNYQNAVSQVPGLGEIPVLGALFRSARWQHNETELIIVVTPRLATPADFESASHAGLKTKEPSTANLLLRGKTDAPAPPPPSAEPAPASQTPATQTPATQGAH